MAAPQTKNLQQTLAPKDVDVKKLKTQQPDSEQTPVDEGPFKISKSEITDDTHSTSTQDTRSRISHIGFTSGPQLTAEDIAQLRTLQANGIQPSTDDRGARIQPAHASSWEHEMLIHVIRAVLETPGLASTAGIKFSTQGIQFSATGGHILHSLQFLSSPPGHRAVQQLQALHDHNSAFTDTMLYELLYQTVNHSLQQGDGPTLATIVVLDMAVFAIEEVHNHLQNMALNMVYHLLQHAPSADAYIQIRDLLFPTITRQSYEQYIHDAINRICEADNDLNRRSLTAFFQQVHNAVSHPTTALLRYAHEQRSMRLITELGAPRDYILSTFMQMFSNPALWPSDRPYGRRQTINLQANMPPF